MEQFTKIISTLILTCFLVLFFDEDANAYIDPATGSYIFQMLLAGLLGALFALKVYWQSVKRFVKNLFSKKSGKELDG